MEVNEQNIGRLIREVRTEKGLSVQDVANLTGISMDHLARIERGESKNPRLDTVLKISKALSIDTATLIGTAN